MRTVEVARYFLPPRPGAGPRAKPYASRFRMTAEEAASRGAIGQVPGSAESREEPETDEERQRTQVDYQSAGHDSVQPPQRKVT